MAKLAKLAIVCFFACELLTVNLNADDDPPPLGKLVDVGGYRVHMYCTGVGSPAVVVVGGGFSFDWGLIQPKVAGLTQICAYDPSGAAWSDPFPSPRTPGCSDRVSEIHEVLRRASIRGPFLIVGFSIGALYGRLYASRYPDEAAGLVIVDHAFIPARPPRPPSQTWPKSDASPPHAPGVVPMSDVDTPPALISQTAIALGIEDDRNFQRLPKLDRDLHMWALSKHPVRPTADTVAECEDEIGMQNRTSAPPLGSKPLIVISAGFDSPEYQALQAKLLRLSGNAEHVIAEHSTHMMIVDAPDTIVTAIGDVLQSIRHRARLPK